MLIFEKIIGVYSFNKMYILETVRIKWTKNHRNYCTYVFLTLDFYMQRLLLAAGVCPFNDANFSDIS